MSFGRHALRAPSFMIRSARFVQSEMPVRLAKRLLDLQYLPYIFVTNPSIRELYEAYHRAFVLLKNFPEVKSMEDNERFTELLKQLVEEQTPLIGVLARGVRECSRRPLIGRDLNFDNFLDNMLRSRISRRVIAEQHIALQRRQPGFIGVICSELLVRHEVERAVAQCRDVCLETFGVCPPVKIQGDVDTTIAYIPAHINYMLLEIFKNASRAVVERHLQQQQQPQPAAAEEASELLPPILVTICRGQWEVTVKVSDQGGGMEPWQQEQAWKYGYSTADDTSLPSMADSQSAAGVGVAANKVAHDSGRPGRVDKHGSPMAGLGFGLPLSRLHAQYFGGDVQMVSLPGYGTDVYVKIHHVGDKAEAFEVEV